MEISNGFLAHVRWFQEPVERIGPGVNATEFFYIALFVLASIGIAYLLQKKYLHSIEELASRLAVPYAKYVPLIVRVSAGAGLMAATISGNFLAPNLENPPLWLLSIQGLISILFIVGAGVRIASLATFFMLIAGTFFYGPIEVAEHIEYAGVAGYLMIMGPGLFSLKELYLREKLPAPKKRQTALRVFMIAAGLSLVWLALSEKILNIDLAQAFLSDHHWNFLSIFGTSDRVFILMIGAFEMLLGLLLIFNITPRLASLAIAGAMLSTAIILGPAEVPGHLYAIGLLAAIWANDGKYDHF